MPAASPLLADQTLANGARLLDFRHSGAGLEPGQGLWLEQAGDRLALPALAADGHSLTLYCPPGAAARLSAPWCLREPWGRGCEPDPAWSSCWLLADAAGFAALMFAARRLRARQAAVTALALLALPAQPPFRPRPSAFLVPALPPPVIAAVPLLEDWGLPSRLACETAAIPGCHHGGLAELLPALLAARPPAGACLYGRAAFIAGLAPILAQAGLPWRAAELEAVPG